MLCSTQRSTDVGIEMNKGTATWARAMTKRASIEPDPQPAVYSSRCSYRTIVCSPSLFWRAGEAASGQRTPGVDFRFKETW